MRYIFYHYNEYGTLVFDYYDDETHVSQSYVFYTLKQAVSKFRRDNGLQYKRIKISKLFQGDNRYGKHKRLEKIRRL